MAHQELLAELLLELEDLWLTAAAPPTGSPRLGEGARLDGGDEYLS